MLLRNPIDRIISEYFFMKDRGEFMSLIKPMPKDLKAYIKSKQTQNYMVGFLIGKRMYDEHIVTKDDYGLVINTIKNLDIKIGIFEHYKASLNYFSSITGIKIPKKIEVKRITLNRPKIEDVSDEIKQLVIEHNKLDFELYNTFRKKFEDLEINESNIDFNSNKYNYIIKYTERFNLLEIGLKNKSFINKNKDYFNELNLFLHKTLNIKDGEIYVASWNASFINCIQYTYPNSNIAKKLLEINIDNHLEKTEEICTILNIILNGKEGKQYIKKLVFDANQVSILKKKGILNQFLSKIFK